MRIMIDSDRPKSKGKPRVSFLPDRTEAAVISAEDGGQALVEAPQHTA